MGEVIDISDPGHLSINCCDPVKMQIPLSCHARDTFHDALWKQVVALQKVLWKQVVVLQKVHPLAA